MNNRLVFVGGAVGLLAAAGQAIGQSVQVELRDSGGALVGSAQNFASGAAINLGTIPTNVARVNVFSVGGSANVGTISLDAGSRGSSLDVFLGTGAIPVVTSVLSPVATNWSGLDVSAATQSKLRVAAGISGNITGPVRAATITRLQVGGGINAEIDASGELGAAADIGVIVAGSVGVDGDIGAGSPGNPGFIGSVTTTAGDMLGDVIATSEIGEVLATNGTLGDATTRVAITAVDGIDSVVAEAINADITANAFGGSGDLRQLLVTDAGSGGIAGTIFADTLGDPATVDPTEFAFSGRGTTTGLSIVANDIVGNFRLDAQSTSGLISVQVLDDWLSSKVHMDDFDAIVVGGDMLGPQGTMVLFTADQVGQMEVDGLFDGNLQITSATLVSLGAFEGLLTGSGQSMLDCSDDGINNPVLLLSAPPFIDLLHIQGDACVARAGVIAVGPVMRVQIDGTFGNVAGVVQPESELTLPWGALIEGETQVRVGGDIRGFTTIGCPRIYCTETELVCNSFLFSNIISNASGGDETTQNGWRGVLAYEGGPEIEGPTLWLPPSVFPLTSTVFLSGATGSVPFRLSDSRSAPKNYARFPVQSVPMLTSAFNGTHEPSSVQLDFQGPVALAGSTSQPKVQVLLLGSNDEPILDVSRFVIAEPQLNSRVIGLRAKDGGSVPLPSGRYQVKPLPGTERLVCADLLPGSPIREVADFEYEFILAPDCNADGITDPANCGDTSICDSIDFNNNGVFPEEEDVTDFFNVLSGGSCSTGDCNDIDFNNNLVFPEEQDVILFFHVLAGGEC